MSHVADGELHALLDGALGQERSGEAERIAAHLRSCDDCRARLEEARALRERAEELLAAAAPARGAMPDFETILERAGGREPDAEPDRGPRAGSGRRDPLRVLAWAASLLLGVALGWGARSAWQIDGNEGSVAMAERETASVTESEPALEDLARADAPGRSEESIASNVGPTSPETAAETMPTSARTGDRRADPGRTGTPPTEPSEPVGPEQDADDIRLQETRVRAPARDSEADEHAAAEELAEAEELAKAHEIADALAPVGQTGFRAERPLEGAGFETPSAAVWIAATPGDAARWLGGRLFLVEGLPLLDVAVSTAEGGRIARVRQLLPSGDVVEIGLAPVDTTSAPLAEGRRGQEVLETVLEMDGLAIRLRAAVAPDSLGALVSRLRAREP